MSSEGALTRVRQDAATDAGAQSRTALISIAAATLLVLLKLVTGILAGSLGLSPLASSLLGTSWRR
jgi:hypothetical protein